MATKSPFHRPSRIPPAWEGLQINFCKNPACPNFGMAPRESTQVRTVGSDDYQLVGIGQGKSALRCKLCGETPPIKNNRAVVEELERMLEGIPGQPSPGCPNDQCANHGVPSDAGKAHYQRFGFTKSGSIRLRCKACKAVFSVAQKAGLRQRVAET